MNCYVKDQKTFRTLCVFPVTDYDLTLWSIYDEVSTLTVSRKKEEKFKEGDFVSAGQYCGIIKEAEINQFTAELKCEHIIKLFSRDLLFDSGPDNGVEQFIKKQIDNRYTDQPDEIYKLPFLNVSAPSRTLSVMSPDIEKDVWNIKSYIAKTRRLLNVFTEFEITRDELKILVHKKPDTVKQIDLSDPSIKVLEESYSRNTVGKITSICAEDGKIENWYLLDNGTITSNYQQDHRVDGDWLTIAVDKAEDVPFKVKDTFAKNTFSHKILFSVPKAKARYDFYDRLKIASSGRLYYSYIAAIRIRKNSNRVEYQCGELRTSFLDKIQEEL